MGAPDLRALLDRRHLAWLGELALLAGVAALSLMLLVYVGYGEARRTYESFFVEKLAAQNNVLAAAIEGFLRRDLPLEQYVGFVPRAERLMSSDRSITSIFVLDGAGRVVFSRGDVAADLADLQGAAQHDSEALAVRETPTRLFVTTPLAGRYDAVGSLVIAMASGDIGTEVATRFGRLILPTLGLALAFAVGAVALAARRRRPNDLAVYAAFAGIFSVLAVVIVATLVGLYTKGAQIKTQALADSLAQRMTEVIGFNLNLAQIPGLDRVFADYRRLNPDISAAALLVDGQITIHTESFHVGQPWRSDAAAYEYLVDVATRQDGGKVTVAVALPQSVVYTRVLRSVKNFAALFVASAFLASVLFQFSGTVRGAPRRAQPGPADSRGAAAGVRGLVKPLFLFTTCVEHLTYSFLPQYLNAIAVAADESTRLIPAVFGIYYLAFALVLIPAGHLAQRFSPKPILVGGLVACALGYVLLMGQDTLWSAALARLLAGLGQGLIFIAVQSLLLVNASENERTRAAGVIVYGFQGGMIAGMAIGSLIVTSIGEVGVLLVATLAMLLLVAYALACIPRFATAAAERAAMRHGGSIFAHTAAAARDREFMATVLCIGIPAKAVLTGIIVFAAPLLLTAQGFAKADIGQLLMLYAGAVMVASALSAKHIDLHRATKPALIAGAILAGVGLVGLSALDWPGFAALPYGDVVQVLLIILSMIVVGIGHGLINAPVVAHVSSLAVARRVGIGGLTAAYRFLERIGHVAGPLVVGLFFQLYGEGGEALLWLSLCLTSLALVFVMGSRRRASATAGETVLAAEPRALAGIYLDATTAALALRLATGQGSASGEASGHLLTGHLLRHGRPLAAEAHETPGLDRAPAAGTLGAFVARYSRSEAGSLGHVVVIAGAPDAVAARLQMLGVAPHDARHVLLLSRRRWVEQMQGWLALLAAQTGRHKTRALQASLAAAVGDAQRAGTAFVWHAAPPTVTAGRDRPATERHLEEHADARAQLA